MDFISNLHNSIYIIRCNGVWQNCELTCYLGYIVFQLLYIFIYHLNNALDCSYFANFFSDEAMFLHRLLANGVDIIHLRKPGALVSDCEHLLKEMSAEDHSHIVIHDFLSWQSLMDCVEYILTPVETLCPMAIRVMSAAHVILWKK